MKHTNCQLGSGSRENAFASFPLLTASYARGALSFLTPVNMHSQTCTLLKMIDNSERNTAEVVKEHQHVLWIYVARKLMEKTSSTYISHVTALTHTHSL